MLCLQLADDFAELSAHTRLVHEPKDELNLVYVALTRAMLGLVCNQNVARLLTAGTTQKYMEVQVRTLMAVPAVIILLEYEFGVATGACLFLPQGL